MVAFDRTITDYLNGPAPYKLELGAGYHGRDGWICTDLNHARPENRVIALDATKPFPIPSDSFDYVYLEHMIEHVTFSDAQRMLSECHRVLKSNGVVRVATPSLGFLQRILSSDRSAFEEKYRAWSVRTFIPDAPNVTNAFFLNNFMRAWGHTFVFDRETLELALRIAGFQEITLCDGLNSSQHKHLCGLANCDRLPAGYLELESMVIEGTKRRTVD